MTLYKFNKLSFPQQLLMLELHGVCLGFREVVDYRIALFQIHAFYVEAYYLNKKKKVERLDAFTSTNKLKPYLEKINLESLLLDI